MNLCIYDIVILFQTWLTNDFCCGEVLFHDFEGGGVLIAVHKILNSKSINVINRNIEHVYVLKLEKKNIS